MSEDEFSIIEDFFAPLATDDGALALKDDAALVDKGALVMTADAMIEGVHFLSSDPLDAVAQKLVRVNISDLAAKGARPIGYLLTCIWPQGVTRKKIATFVDGLACDQETFRISLFGGDTTVHKTKGAPLTISATFFGAPPRHGIVNRNGAASGDDIYVTGTIGDAGLGLRALQKKERITGAHRAFVIERYQVPSPRAALGGALSGLATASVDISDGLIADCAHLVTASGETAGASLKATLWADALPVSPAAEAWIEAQGDAEAARARLAGFGDDYEILFTAPPSRRRSVEMAANVAKTSVTRVGALTKRGDGADAPVVFLGADKKPLFVETAGFNHFG